MENLITSISQNPKLRSGFSITIRNSNFRIHFFWIFFKDLLIGKTNQEFWGSSFLILKDFDHSLIPLWILYITPLLVVLAIPFSYYLFIKN